MAWIARFPRGSMYPRDSFSPSHTLRTYSFLPGSSRLQSITSFKGSAISFSSPVRLRVASQEKVHSVTLYTLFCLSKCKRYANNASNLPSWKKKIMHLLILPGIQVLSQSLDSDLPGCFDKEFSSHITCIIIQP